MSRSRNIKIVALAQSCQPPKNFLGEFAPFLGEFSIFFSEMMRCMDIFCV